MQGEEGRRSTHGAGAGSQQRFVFRWNRRGPAGNSYSWPDAVAEKVLRSFHEKVGLFEFTRLNYLAGAVYAECARALMRERSLKPGDLEVIGFDGQTIYQEPPEHEKCPRRLRPHPGPLSPCTCFRDRNRRRADYASSWAAHMRLRARSERA